MVPAILHHMQDPWHYPRTEHTKAIMDRLDTGLTHAIVMFGPRRTGKTEFLRQDLAPAASAAGWFVVYANFYDVKAPLAVLIREIQRALSDRKGYVQRLLGGLSGTGALKFSVPVPGTGGIEISLGGETPAEEQGAALDYLFDQLAQKKRRTLLLLDEFQEIGTGDTDAALVKTLRTKLDELRPKVCTVMTGSSQEKLRAVLDERTAPFYRFATELPLPPLDDGFVDHMIGRFREVTGRKLKAKEALQVFETYERNPQLFRVWLDRRVDYPDLDADDAALRARAELARSEGFLKLWADLTPELRVVTRMLAERQQAITGQAGSDRAAELGQAMTTSQIQTRLNTLTRNGIADKLGRERVLTDPAFAAWVRERPLDEF
ncbi:ATP-binding protein [Halovulum sp. GXIMD14794]